MLVSWEKKEAIVSSMRAWRDLEEERQVKVVESLESGGSHG